jgi:hypothetical protein
MRAWDPSLRIAIGGAGTKGFLEILDALIDRDDAVDLANVQVARFR